jgi:hypothetical protein
MKENKLEDVWEVLPVQTPNYKFNLEYIAKVHDKGVYDSGHLFVGDTKNPCLSITFSLPGIRKLNTRFEDKDISVAYLNKIKNIKECVLESTEKNNKPSFTKEMLVAVIKEIKKSFSHILHLQLDDSSYIPCDGEDDSNTLDLIVYSTALYKKSWYEKEFNAYFIPRDSFIEYKCKVEKYASPETKLKYSWKEFYNNEIVEFNLYAKNIFKEKYLEYEHLYESSKTFPEFFIALSKTVPREYKCKFFKNWLNNFIQYIMNIPIQRRWYIDLYTVQKGGTRKRRKTRRRRAI